MKSLKLIWNYYQSLLLLNIAFSFLFSFYRGWSNKFAIHFFTFFVFAGFILSVFYFELVRKKEYYFYYNQSFTKWRLILSAFVVNLFTGVLILLLMRYAELS